MSTLPQQSGPAANGSLLLVREGVCVCRYGEQGFVERWWGGGGSVCGGGNGEWYGEQGLLRGREVVL